MAKAIDTDYNGYRFRSRLEARWAVFFDALGIKYKYEVEGFNLDGVRYLPDFWFPHTVPDLAADGWGMWGEIKPRQITEDELNKVVALVTRSKHNALIFQGDPWPGEYSATKVSGTHFDPPKVIADLAFSDEEGIVSLRGNNFSSYPTVFHQDLQAAYEKARGARFEHGEKPTT